MFTSNKMPLYPNLRFTASIRDRNLAVISETDPAKLMTMIKEHYEQNDFDRASLAAQKMAIYYGVPGLIQYFDVVYKQLENLRKENEEIKTMGMSLLIYLDVAQKVFERDPIAKELTARILSQEENERMHSEEYWEEKKNKLIELADLEELKDEADHASADMLNRVIDHGSAKLTSK